MGPINERHIFGVGTSEQTWQPYLTPSVLPQRTLQELWPIRPERVHIVAPHPDDEVFACGGVLQQCAAANIDVWVWAVTEGERSHPPTPQRSTEALAQQRAAESHAALALLCPRAKRIALGFPDGAVSNVEARLQAVLAQAWQAGEAVFAPWHLDGHPDHEATARASRLAARHAQCVYYEVPIWGWHWADPHADQFPFEQALALALSVSEQQRKAQAIQCFQSQLQADALTGADPVVPPFALERWQRAIEVLVR